MRGVFDLVLMMVGVGAAVGFVVTAIIHGQSELRWPAPGQFTLGDELETIVKGMQGLPGTFCLIAILAGLMRELGDLLWR